MRSGVEGEWDKSKPELQIKVQHVFCIVATVIVHSNSKSADHFSFFFILALGEEH